VAMTNLPSFLSKSDISLRLFSILVSLVFA